MKLIRQIFSAAAIGLAAFIFTECKSETPQMSPKLDEETLDELIEEGKFYRADQILDEAEKCEGLTAADKYLLAVACFLGELLAFFCNDSSDFNYVRLGVLYFIQFFNGHCALPPSHYTFQGSYPPARE